MQSLPWTSAPAKIMALTLDVFGLPTTVLWLWLLRWAHQNWATTLSSRNESETASYSTKPFTLSGWANCYQTYLTGKRSHKHVWTAKMNNFARISILQIVVKHFPLLQSPLSYLVRGEVKAYYGITQSRHAIASKQVICKKAKTLLHAAGQVYDSSLHSIFPVYSMFGRHCLVRLRAYRVNIEGP